MPYRYLEDITVADVAFEATGNSLEELFMEASKATLNTMIEHLDSLETRLNREVSLSAFELDMLLFSYLQELLFLHRLGLLVSLPFRQ